MIVFIDDILMYSNRNEKHEDHVCIVLVYWENRNCIFFLKKFYIKFLKREFCLPSIAFLGILVSKEGVW